MSLKVVIISPNSAEPDHNELLYYAAFHLGLHCLPKDLLLGVQNEKYCYNIQAFS